MSRCSSLQWKRILIVQVLLRDLEDNFLQKHWQALTPVLCLQGGLFVPFRVFLAEQFEFLQPHLDAVMPAVKKPFLQQFYSQVRHGLFLVSFQLGAREDCRHTLVRGLVLVPISLVISLSKSQESWVRISVYSPPNRCIQYLLGNSYNF